MKKFVIIVVMLVALYLGWDFCYYQLGWYVDLHPEQEITTFVTTDETNIYILHSGGPQAFEVRGVNMGAGLPGKWATDYAIDEQTYLRWFSQIQDMGANTVRVYTILSDAFYNAFYAYNQGREEPLYLLQGVWVNDYVQNSRLDAYDDAFFKTFLDDCRKAVDVIHGRRKITVSNTNMGSGSYRKDISQWVLGYIIGVEWEDVTVCYTDEKYPERNHYQGDYFYTDQQATAFEALLAEAGDRMVAYESARYKTQRLLAFSNWPTTDPFDYPEEVANYFMKCAKVDVEHIKTTERFLSGQFASYHVYPYYPDYLSYVSDWQSLGLSGAASYYDENGVPNTYRAYLTLLRQHHTMPVVISEFGVSTGRGMAQRDQNTGRNQGNQSEDEQGQALVDCFEDIMAAGCSGGCVFSWQDEWFKRTWNTMYAVDLRRTPYWSDYQTNEQYFGLLSFDPGEEQSVCYVDGDVSEWSEADVVSRPSEDLSVSMKYDEKFLYLRIHKDQLDFSKDVLYLPIDTTPKTGSNYCANYDLKFERNADFVLVLDGEHDSRLQVQARYESLRSTYYHETAGLDAYLDPPDGSCPQFVNIDLILQTATPLLYGDLTANSETYETGLLTYGDANPSHEDFNSLADFMVCADDIEVKLPWQLLNFADPSRMKIHDDYYDGHYGVDYLSIDCLYIGVGLAGAEGRIAMDKVPLEGWGNKVTFHERLKRSYYHLQQYWTARP